MLHHVLNKVDSLLADLSRFRGHQVLADPFIHDLEQIRRMMMACIDRGPSEDPWISLPRAMREHHLSASYFRAKLRSHGRRSRLEVWRDQGLAKQEGRGWFVSRAIELRDGRESAVTPAPEGPAMGDLEVDAQLQRMDFSLP